MAAYISRIRPVCVEMTGKVALITGGASGLGRAVATSLAQKGWKLSIVDLNTEAGEQTAKTLSGDFHKTDVTDYKSLSSAFHKTFQEHRQIDFVFANAGILERDSFYKQYSGDNPPPEPDMLSVDICLDAVIKTTWLAQHYFRLNPEGSSGCLINTSSTGGIYSSPFCPMYAAAKHGVLGFTRSIAKHMYVNDNIRANAILPGVMRTNLLNEKEWGTFDEANVEWTPMNKVVEVVEMLMDDKHKYWGKAVEISGTRHYVREQQEYCDEQMRKVMDVTDADNV